MQKSVRMNLSIKNKIAASFILAFILLLFFSFITFRNVNGLIKHNDRDHQLQLLLKSLNEFDLSLIQIETTCRNYALAGKDEFLPEYEKAILSSQLKWSNFKKLSLDAPSPVKSEVLLEIEKLLNRSIEYSNQLIKARQDFGIREATNIALTNRGFRVAEEILRKLNEIQNNQLSSFLESDKREVEKAKKTLVLFAIMLLFMILILISTYFLLNNDIIGRKNAENKLIQTNENLEKIIKERTTALFESEKKYRLLATNATDIISLHGIDLKFIYISDSVERILGYKPDELLGKTPFDFIHTDDIEYLKSRLEEMPNRNSVKFSEYRFKKKDGTYLWLEVAANYTHTEQGVISGIITNSRDISLRKNAEDLLHKNQHLLQSVFNNTSSIIIIKDIEGRYLMVNKQFEKVHNTSIDKLIGKTVYDILPLELAELITTNDKNTIETKQLIEHEELVTHLADGSLHTYLSMKFPIVDDTNKVYLLCAIATDITEKKKHEKEILESKARLDAILDNANSSIWSIDRNYKLTGSNRLHQKTFQEIYDFKAYLGMDVLDHLDSKTQEIWKQFYDRALSGEQFWEETSETVFDKEHFFDISFSPIWIHNKVEGVSVFARDNTSRKKTEQQLYYKVNELNTFMYKATHDLRSPLASVIGLVKLAKDITVEPELKQYFNMIDTSVNRMDKLLIDLFNIVNVTQGKLNISVIDFETMVDEIIDSLSNRPNFSEIIFRKKIKSDTLFFHSDSRLLYSVLQNIIDNAIKYKRASSFVEPIILITITVIDNVARISVSDNGTGIPSELQNKVFDMFFRATSGTNGTGLGLYIVKSTVEKLGGEVRLKSEENHGTSVFVTLPNLME
ncbi:MAG: hypothetical protein A3F72_18430 [Bacteroidetes bacterium RIFCSPLOWO2_12_FULL_35_15]|nr:MAG: hypothetical protein A3F72_18430 [Bacteroidetes bacterium RIFCSPLOWO2_12_FULL_35_15]